MVVANSRWTDLVGKGSVTAVSNLEHVDDRRPFGEVAAGWLAESGRISGADFERTSPQYGRFRCYAAPVDRLDGALLGRIFVLRDVTHETEVERQRSAFVAAVSHELRAPLTVIQGYSETLLDDLHQGWWDPDAERDLLEIVQSSADTLGRLVENLLDAATLEAGGLRLQPEPVRVERIAERLVTRRDGLTNDHQVRIETAPGLPLALADPLRVEQVLTNLIDNAVKYSPGGGRVTVRIDPGVADGELTVSVSDHGLGLDAEQARRVFDRFYRAGEPNGGSPRGVGLGLFLCKRLVEAQGGRIWVESEPGVGSTFRFTLPTLVEVQTMIEPQTPEAIAVLDDSAQPVGAGR
jgi:signal transduction histidine kinase